MSICKRLNPDVEVPGVLDLIQQISDMLESNATERIVSIEKNDDCFVSIGQFLDACISRHFLNHPRVVAIVS